MKIKANQIKYLLLGTGIIGFLLRVLLYTEGRDGTGLLTTGHWTAVALWLLTGAIAAALFLLTRSIQGPDSYEDAFPVSPGGAIGALLGAVGFLILSIRQSFSGASNLEIAALLLGYAAALCLVCIAVCRLFRRKPSFLFHTVVCIGFALRMICRYRVWNSEPQLQNYCFYMMASICLMLAAYQFAAFDAGIGNHKALWFWGLSATFLCCLSAFGSQDGLALIFWGAWTFTNLSCLTVKPRRRRQTLDLKGNGEDSSVSGENPL